MESLNSTFTQSEIIKMSSIFKEVIILTEDKNQYNFPTNVKKHILPVNSSTSKKRILLNNFFSIQFILLADLFSKNTSIAYLKEYLLRQSYLLKYIDLSKTINNKYTFSKSDVLYSFFTYNNALLPTFLKKKHNCKFITCTHGGDLFEERYLKTKKLSFRKFIFKNADLILSVSKNGVHYLNKKYSEFNPKIKVYYLGTNKRHLTDNPLKDSDKPITIVSVADTARRDVKRIELIPNILIALSEKYKTSIIWYHIGTYDFTKNEGLRIAIDKLKTKHNITYKLKGKLSNEEIMSMYAFQPITAFISVSKTEGLPFSMMEASSFGIPVISTDVGGCREIVDSKLLLDENFSNEQILNAFDFLFSNQIELRKKAKLTWSKNFSNDRSIQNFKNLIAEIQ